MLSLILQKIRPESKWLIKDDELFWEDTAKSKPTAEELEEGRLLVQQDLDASSEKKNGVAYTLNGEDYLVPFMKDDADGLMQVNAAFTLGLTETVIYFTNGTKMPITAAEFQDFATWFVTKRNSFFTL